MVLSNVLLSVYEYAQNPTADSDGNKATAVFMLFPFLIFLGIGLACLIWPASIERSTLRWRGYDDTEPSEQAIRRVRTGGIIILLGALGYFGLFLYMLIKG